MRNRGANGSGLEPGFAGHLLSTVTQTPTPSDVPPRIDVLLHLVCHAVEGCGEVGAHVALARIHKDARAMTKSHAYPTLACNRGP